MTTTKNNIFAIGIPTINRADLLQETLEKYSKDFPNTAIYVVDNGLQDFKIDKLGPNIMFIGNSKNVGVAASWNQLLGFIFNGTEINPPCNHALILNDDIYLGRTEEQMNKFIVENPITLATTTKTWCAFIISKHIFNTVGYFDSAFFPAYFEDNDYAYRLKLSGYDHTVHEFLDPVIYINSATIQKNPELNYNFENNRQHYIKKWGGMPYKEIYLTAFNEI